MLFVISWPGTLKPGHDDTGELGTRKTVLTGVPGKLVGSSRMPLTDSSPASGAVRETQAGTVDLEVGGSLVYLVLNW